MKRILAVLGLGAALGCGPAHGAGSATIKVSAMILPRIACGPAAPGAASPEPGRRDPVASAGGCRGNAETRWRIRRVEAHPGSVVLIIEP